MESSTSQVIKFRHPGQGRRRAPVTPKGRQLDPDALLQVRETLGDADLRPDLLIEHLHAIQDRFGCLRANHLVALAHLMRLALAEVYETATFYAHFDIVTDENDVVPPVTVRVCDSLTCEMLGARQLLETLERNLDGDVRVVRAPCMGRCDTAPVAEVGHRHVDQADLAKITDLISSKSFAPEVPNYPKLKDHLDAGGYEVLQECIDGERSREELIDRFKKSPLRGLGGAGFPTGLKWQIVRGYDAPRLMAVNADEGEPGTFKDRYVLETEPHVFLEGMLIAAWVVEAETVYIYLRDEYPAAREILLEAMAQLREAGIGAHTEIVLRRGAGAYICGEESSMIESIEGKRGLPRHRPPYVAENGIFGRPTLVQNVETLYWVPGIAKNGAEWFAGYGENGCEGLRSYSVSGRVKSPGVKVAGAGSTVRDLIKMSGGIADGHQFKAYLPGGASGGILPASLDDVPLDFGKLDEYGCFVGSHAVVILSDQDSMKDVALNLMRFFEDESCGQCTPCRIGTEKAVKMMRRDRWDEQALGDISQVMADASICGLGQAAANPLLSVLRYFREELQC